MPIELIFGDPTDDHVLVTVLRRAFPEVEDDFDRDQLDCNIEIRTGPVRASFRARWLRSRLLKFKDSLEELNQSLNGSVELVPEYGTSLRMTISADPAGHVAIKGEAIPDPAYGPWLRFGFTCDQTYFGPLLFELELLAEDEIDPQYVIDPEIIDTFVRHLPELRTPTNEHMASDGSRSGLETFDWAMNVLAPLVMSKLGDGRGANEEALCNVLAATEEVLASTDRDADRSWVRYDVFDYLLESCSRPNDELMELMGPNTREDFSVYYQARRA